MARCARCGTAWLARHVPGDVYGAEAVASRPAPPRQSLIIEGEVVAAPRRPAYVAVRPVPPAARPRAEIGRPPLSGRRLAGLGAAIGVAVLLALALPIAGAIPGLAGLFSSGDAIVLDQVTSSSQKVGGADVIMVEGELTNTTGGEMPVPAIRISLRTDDEGDAYSWLVEPSAMRLAAGASIGFRSALTNPVPGASRIAVSLAPREQRIGLR